MDFVHIPLWIQIWGLPLHCKTVAMEKHLSNQIGIMEDAVVYDYPDNAKIVKIRVLIDISKPIRAGMYIGNDADGINWVDFRYENLPMLCFTCGLVGHNEENCKTHSQFSAGKVNPIGPWLRSNIYGKRIHEKKDVRFHSNPMKSVSGGQFSPIPKAMLKMMANLHINKEPNSGGQKTADIPGNSASNQQRSGHDMQMNMAILKRKIIPVVVTPTVPTSTSNSMTLVGLGNKAGQEP